MSTLMDSLEFYLLAPLGYILLRTLGNYMFDFAIELDGQPKGRSLSALMSVKALSMGLLIAVLATHLVSLFLEPADIPNNKFPSLQLECGVLLLLALILDYWVIEQASKSKEEGAVLHPEPPDDDSPLGDPPPA
jgi:uncharacterized membrane protein YqjE